jgi:hypothetical protein
LSVFTASASWAPVQHMRLAKMPISVPLCLIAQAKILNPMNPLAASVVGRICFRGNPG